MIPLLFVTLIAQQNPGADSATQSDLRVIVTAPVYHPDGAVTGETTTVGAVGPSVLHMFSRRTLCETAPPSAAEPSDAGFGWRVAAHIVRASDSQVVVNVDWKRVWDRAQRITNGPTGTVQLALKRGDRIPLDHISNNLRNDACRAVGMGLEIRLSRTTPVTSSAAQTLPIGAREGGAGQLDVDLWLLHTTPSGSQHAQHQTVRLSTAGGEFTFAPVRFETTRGEVGLELTGSFQRYSVLTGGEFLLLSMSRLISGASAPPAGLAATSSSFVAVPAPDEVLSFEMSTTAGGFGGGGGRGGARGGGGGGQRGGGGSIGAGSAASGNRGGGGAVPQAGSPRGGIAGASGNLQQAITLLDGHRFAVRMKVTPVPGI